MTTTTPGSTKPWPHTQPIDVIFRDLDPLGHVNNAVHFTWMENLRTQYYLKIHGSLDTVSLDFVLAEATCRYLKPIRFGQALRGEMAPTEVGTTSWGLLYRFVDPADGTVLARGRSVQVCIDPKTFTKRPIPVRLRTVLMADSVSPDSEGWANAH